MWCGCQASGARPIPTGVAVCLTVAAVLQVCGTDQTPVTGGCQVRAFGLALSLDRREDALPVALAPTAREIALHVDGEVAHDRWFQHGGSPSRIAAPVQHPCRRSGPRIVAGANRLRAPLPAAVLLVVVCGLCHVRTSVKGMVIRLYARTVGLTSAHNLCERGGGWSRWSVKDGTQARAVRRRIAADQVGRMRWPG